MMKRLVDLKGAELRRTKENGDGDLVVPMAFSSEEPVDRWWGVEILDHGEASVRLERLNDGAPVLFNHNPGHSPGDLIGTHEPGTVKLGKDRVLRGEVRVTSATQQGREAVGLIESRVLTKASIGYRVHKVVEQTTKRDGTKVERVIPGDVFERAIEKLESSGGRVRELLTRELDRDVFPIADRKEDEDPIYRVMDWEPFENSFVTIPADNTVGLGRTVKKSSNDPATAVSQQAATPAIHLRGTMKTPEELAAEQAAAEEARKKAERAAMEAAERKAREELAAREAQAGEMEKSRIRAINNLAKVNSISDNIRDAWIQQGYGLEQVSNDLIRINEERSKNNPGSAAGAIGMSKRDAKNYSLLRAIRAVADGDWSKAGLEAEASRDLAQKLGRVVDSKAFLVPFEVLERSVDTSQFDAARFLGSIVGKRDLTVASAGGGGYLVGTDNVGFIEILRNRSVAMQMGVTRLSGLQGNVTIPRQSAAATAYWLSTEATAITESQQTFVQVALSPKTAGAYTEISRLLLLQSSPGAEGIVTDDLAQVVALAADLAVLEGSGAAGQPTGLSNTSGIGSVASGSITYDRVLEFQTDVATSNVRPGRGGYVTDPVTARVLMQKQRFTSTDTPLWQGNIWDGQMAGFPAMSSNQPTAGTLTFGDWAELILAEWGVLEVSVNPYAQFATGIIGVRAMYSLDVGCRRPFAFSRATGVTA